MLSASVPELAALDLFRSVVELGSLSKAAKLHRIAQPSASSRIRTLEAQLGITVLERTPTGSRPTPEGQLVAEWADAVLDAAEQMAVGVASLRAERVGLLRIAASYTIAEYLLPPWLDRFLADRSDDSISLDVTNSDAVVDRLDAGTVDLGFIESPNAPASMAQQIVGTDELIVVVSSRHTWAGQPNISIETLCATPLVLRERGSGTRRALADEIARQGHEMPSSALDLGSLSAVRIAVINGSAPTVISRLAVRDDLVSGSLVEVPVVGLQIKRRLLAVWPRRTTPPRLAQAFLAHLSSELGAAKATPRDAASQ
jgi:DNA-binding transcriptional LysR family regulator